MELKQTSQDVTFSSLCFPDSFLPIHKEDEGILWFWTYGGWNAHYTYVLCKYLE